MFQISQVFNNFFHAKVRMRNFALSIISDRFGLCSFVSFFEAKTFITKRIKLKFILVIFIAPQGVFISKLSHFKFLIKKDKTENKLTLTSQTYSKHGQFICDSIHANLYAFTNI